MIRGGIRGDQMPHPEPATQATDQGPKERRGMVRWRDLLLVGTSALLSGIAVVVWNRRSLQKMRETALPAVEEQTPADREFI